jgi:LytS/YehU family sensor histidine kinase
MHGHDDMHGPHETHRPPLIFGQHDIISIVVLIMMLGMNLGIKLYFRQQGDRKKMKELERQNLEQQLEYLKYQINPHFFMNTLNNIHALVDIEPEKAKHTILELSKMMRFVLYEGNKQAVPLDREIAFLQNYITLMKLRYTDKVRINIETPNQLPNKEVPPLMFITFVENAFKHGVSYRQESFIDISLAVVEGDKLAFTCRNSRIPASEDNHGGVGLKNVKQRLDLIYGNDYTLDIRDLEDEYDVRLIIPLLPNTPQS